MPPPGASPQKTATQSVRNFCDLNGRQSRIALCGKLLFERANNRAFGRSAETSVFCIFLPLNSLYIKEGSGTDVAQDSALMKLFFISCIAAIGLTSLVGCADEQRQTTTSSYESSSMDTKDVHHRR